MSYVLMCDNCGDVFSANEKYREYAENMVDPQNTRNQVGTKKMHIGPCCLVNNEGRPLKPRIPGSDIDEKLIETARKMLENGMVNSADAGS